MQQINDPKQTSKSTTVRKKICILRPNPNSIFVPLPLPLGPWMRVWRTSLLSPWASTPRLANHLPLSFLETSLQVCSGKELKSAGIWTSFILLNAVNNNMVWRTSHVTLFIWGFIFQILIPAKDYENHEIQQGVLIFPWLLNTGLFKN